MSTLHHSCDLAIIGAGPGGYVAAIRAAQLGLKTSIIEANHLGGICLNWGCIPTKALLRASELYHQLETLEEFGLKAQNFSFDCSKVVERSRKVAEKLTGGVKGLLKKNNVATIFGRASFHGKEGKNHILKVEKEGQQPELIGAPNIIIATGARARQLPHLEADGQHIWTYKEAMIPEKVPASLLIVGSGAIGIEYASFYAAMGAKVTVVEVLERILPAEDEEISTLARKAFEKRGITIHTDTNVKSLEKTSQGIKAHLEQKSGPITQTVDKVILAVGITANTENLGLEQTKVKVDKGHILTDEWAQTAEPGVYAIGDVAGAPWLAHKASHEGITAVEHIAGLASAHPLKRSLIPGCTYSAPQIASVGLTESQAISQGYTLKVGRFPFLANGKALAMGEPEGLIKTIFDAKTGELLGAHMIGAEVTELIQGFCIAKTLEATESDLIQTIFPHPTLSEMMHEAVLNAEGRGLHY